MTSTNPVENPTFQPQSRIHQLERQLLDALQTIDTLQDLAINLLDLTSRYMRAYAATTNALRDLESTRD